MYIELTITEIAARLRVSERTALRRIADGTLSAEKRGQNRYLVDTEEMAALSPKEWLVSLDSRILELERQVADMKATVETHLQTLEYRMGNVERRLDRLESTPIEMSEVPVPLAEVSPDVSRPEKPVRIASESQTGTLPEGHVNYTQFYRDHGISSGVADRAREKKFFPVQVGNWWDARGHQITLALDALGMWNFCVYFKTKGKLRECSRPGCACHEVGQN